MRKLWKWIKFGKITAHTKAVDGGVVSEVAYIGRFGLIVGYWAHGSFDPQLPYQGD